MNINVERFYDEQIYRALALGRKGKYGEAQNLCRSLLSSPGFGLYRTACVNWCMAAKLIDPNTHDPKDFAQECLNNCQLVRQLDGVSTPRTEACINRWEWSSQAILDTTIENLQAKWSMVSVPVDDKGAEEDKENEYGDQEHGDHEDEKAANSTDVGMKSASNDPTFTIHEEGEEKEEDGDHEDEKADNSNDAGMKSPSNDYVFTIKTTNPALPPIPPKVFNITQKSNADLVIGFLQLLKDREAGKSVDFSNVIARLEAFHSQLQTETSTVAGGGSVWEGVKADKSFDCLGIIARLRALQSKTKVGASTRGGGRR